MIWILFENGIVIVKIQATLNAIFELRRINEWIVTAKTNNSAKKKAWKISFTGCQIYTSELLIGLFSLAMGIYAHSVSSMSIFSLYVLLQGKLLVH